MRLLATTKALVLVLGVSCVSFAQDSSPDLGSYYENLSAHAVFDTALEHATYARSRNRAPQPKIAEIPEGQREIAEAHAARRRLHFVEVEEVVVVEVLPDDNHGRPHQKWVFQLDNGLKIMAVYNTDTGDRIPLDEGDVISIAGEFIYQNKGSLIHWLHADPKQKRPDGYVLHEGEKYGELDEFDDVPQNLRRRLLKEKELRERQEEHRLRTDRVYAREQAEKRRREQLKKEEALRRMRR